MTLVNNEQTSVECRVSSAELDMLVLCLLLAAMGKSEPNRLELERERKGKEIG